MTPLCHRLRTLLGGELGNEAADRIEALERNELTAEKVAVWLETQGLTAVRAVDAQRGERCKSACIAETRDDKGDFIKWYVKEYGIPPRDFIGASLLFEAFAAGRALEQKQ